MGWQQPWVIPWVALVNWVMGLYLRHFEHRRWFPLKRTSLSAAKVSSAVWLLDVIAGGKRGGWRRVNLYCGGYACPYIAVFSAGGHRQGLRYAVVIALFLGWQNTGVA
ncbi:MAG: hypothetical protein U5M23_15425 [Marinagarivorans sp.]|nr:hypothetical protein [Marinagarivorans sp.]